jgi:predicted nucleic acid-binding protein
LKIVLDASVALAFVFGDEESPLVIKTLLALRNGRACVPYHWPFEVNNGLLMAIRSKRLAPKDAPTAQGLLLGLPVTPDPLTVDNAWGTAFVLAEELQLTAYDAAYLELALRQEVPLATLDDRLRRAAREAGVTLFG